MDHLFRSEDMKYIGITMTNDSAHATVRELGKVGKLHLVDLSGSDRGHAGSKQHNSYKKRLQDCLLWEKKLHTLQHELISFGVGLYDGPLLPVPSADIIATVQSVIEPLENELNSSINFLKENRRLMAQQVERRHTLTLCQDLDLPGQAKKAAQQQQNEQRGKNEREAQPLVAAGAVAVEMEVKEEQRDSFRNYLCGVIAIDQQAMFRRMLYRVSRGNAFARFADIEGLIEDPATGEYQRKSVFYVVALGSEQFTRIKKMCDLFKANIYELPLNREGFMSELDNIRTDIRDKQDVSQRTEEYIQSLLTKLGHDSQNQTCPLRNMTYALQQERVICAVMMKAHFYETVIALEGWVPVIDLQGVKEAVKLAVAGTGHAAGVVEVDPASPILLPGAPPTYFKLNKFTSTFQGIVDTYGVPRYKEVNPGLWTIVTFPFLFGVMYGDIGHGILLSLAAYSLIHFEAPLLEKQKKGQLNEILGMAFGGRYIIFMMGLFATYCGMVYNDCLSIPLNVYGSTWTPKANTTDEYEHDGSTYPMGVDPIWSHKVNELAFYNSLKMKMAIILGVCHMLFGIILSLFNHLYFKDMLSVWFEFLPRFIFMLSTFGYMSWMILYKWCQDWNDGMHNSPPNLIQTMIAMFLSPGSIEPDKQLYSGQAGFQIFLLLCAFFSVPVMLLVKPLIHKSRHEKEAALKKTQQQIARAFDEERKEEAVVAANADESGEHHGFNFGDEMIHSGIHTIEFVLGAVSNTASYLRLWALSLAHAQLSGVFWSKMIMQYGALTGNGIMAFIGFAVWAVATFAVLLCMDALECFLHALRLHWVEFQSKFYYADGIAFEPFNFENVAEHSHKD